MNRALLSLSGPNHPAPDEPARVDDLEQAVAVGSAQSMPASSSSSTAWS